MLLVSVVFAWEKERPSYHVTIGERAESANTSADGYASVGLGVHIDHYTENDPWYEPNDTLRLRLVATGNTRKGITYGVYSDVYSWYSDLPYTLMLGDDEVVSVSMEGITARFYGGVGSAEYTCVWVCSNGFIVLYDPEDPAASPPEPSKCYPETIPHPADPDIFIAPFWRDLRPDLGGSITYGPVILSEPIYKDGFCISWNNVSDGIGNRQTFQVVIQKMPGFGASHRYLQSKIWFQYKTITLDGPSTVVGIEDQEGLKGVSVDNGTLSNEMTLVFQQELGSYSAYIGTVTIKIIKKDAYSLIDIEETSDWIRAHNIKLNSEDPDPEKRFAVALAGWATLLMGNAGLMIGATLATMQLVSSFAEMVSPAEYLEIKDDFPDPVDEHYIKAPAFEPVYELNPVDIILGNRLWWVLTDPNDLNHSLDIIAEFSYVIINPYNDDVVGNGIVSTSVNLKLPRDANNSFDTAKEVPAQYYSDRFYLGGIDDEDYFKVWAEEGQTIFVGLYPPSGADFDLYLYDTSQKLADKSESKEDLSEYVSLTADSTGYWFIRSKMAAGGGFYGFSVIVYWPSDGGGCPYVSTWNGPHYVMDNNLIPAAEHSNGTDITDYYKLEQLLAFDKGRYSLLISDIDKHSYLDEVQLLSADHESDENVAVSPQGEILTYRNPAPPQTAVTNEGYDVVDLVNSIDGSYYEGWPGDYLTLDFGNLDVTNGAKLVVRSDASCPVICKQSVHVQVMNSTGWADLASFIPRLYWSTDIIDLSAYLPDINNQLRVRLYFTGNHKIDFVGLDTTKQGEFETRTATLVSAVHSNGNDVKEALMTSDNLYAELLPGEQITLKFTIPQNAEEIRDFIIIVEGHYFSIGQN